MDAIFLDIDGTLWDSTHTVSEAWSKVLNQKSDVKADVSPDRLKTLFGKPLADIAAVIFAAIEAKNIGKPKKPKVIYTDEYEEKQIKGINC